MTTACTGESQTGKEPAKCSIRTAMNLSVEPVTALCKSTGVCALPSSPVYSQPSLAGWMKSTWIVESCLSRLLVVGDGGGVERLAQLLLGPRPLGIVRHVLGHVLVSQ